MAQKEQDMSNELFSPEEMLSPFESIKEADAEEREWWNSRKLARLFGYLKYWNFERLMDKVATFLQQEKGLDLKEHMVEIEEMAQLNNGGWRQVNVSVLFSQDTFWLSQKRMSELFAVTVQDISYHLIQINDSGELQLSTAIKKFLNPTDNCEAPGSSGRLQNVLICKRTRYSDTLWLGE